MISNEQAAWDRICAKVEASGRAYRETYHRTQAPSPADVEAALHALIGIALIVKGATRYKLSHWNRIGQIAADNRNRELV